MSLTIANTPSTFHSPLGKSPAQRAETSLPTPPSDASVTISNEAQTRLQQEQATQKPSLSTAELRAVHSRTHSADSPWRNKLLGQMNTLGKNAPALSELPATNDPNRLAQARQAADFLYASHTLGSTSGSPYSDLSRDTLSDIIYDESGEYTDVERYAALRTRNDQDEAFKVQLGQLIFQPDQRLLYKGILEYYDALSPIEQVVYPDNHRETWQNLLDNEELRFGKLDPKLNVWELLMGDPSTPKTDTKP